MDGRAAECGTPATREMRALFLNLASRWRGLAVRALRQDTWADMNRSTH